MSDQALLRHRNAIQERLVRLLHLSPRTADDLAGILRATRREVLAEIRALRQAGYAVRSSGRLGYALSSPPDALTPEAIRPLLTSRRVGCVLHSLARTASTNDVAADLARQGSPDGTVVVAETQQRGRGRLGRSWYSPSGRGLYLSVALRPPIDAADAPALTLVAAVAAAEGLRDRTGVAPEIKWPNDLLLGGRKVAGILTELTVEGRKVAHIVVGIGVNVRGVRSSFPRSLRGRATSIEAELGQAPPRAALCASILARLDQRYSEFLKRGPGPALSRWRTFARFLGKRVRIEAPGERLEGVAVDIDPRGALIVRARAGGLQRILAGDLTILS